MSDSLKLPPIHPAGRPFVLGAVGLTLLFFLFGWTALAWLGVVLSVWVAAFFRDPVRAVPQGEGLVIAPADGVICQIASEPPPADLDMDPQPLTRVSIFMNVFNVHVNRAPMAGRIERIIYIPGKFLNASLDKASRDNERMCYRLVAAGGVEIAFVQIAGLVARRIIRFVAEGDSVEPGQRVGMIRFGSRVDVYLPAGCGAEVALGQTIVAGETILARLGRSDSITAQLQ